MSVTEKVQLWRGKAQGALAEELESLLSDEKALEDRFYKDLEFGTGGLRGIIGVGTNCLNVYTVARATQGVAEYMKAHGMKRAAISYDSRVGSELFAKTAACVFADGGIAVLIVRELMPTPFLSYLTRREHCDIGVMITASHNPARYNGYKVYDGSGCQIVDAAAAEISGYIGQTEYFRPVRSEFERCLADGRIVYSGEEAEEDYLGGIERIVKTSALSDLSVCYTALNGTGYRIVPKLLRRAGVGRLDLVEEQCVPDGTFPTCPYPNPEKREALALGLRRAEERGSDLLLATDPDADRIGVAVKREGKCIPLSGNDVGVLLLDFLCAERVGECDLSRMVAVKTIVTTPLADRIAADYGVRIIDVLTGFKYIGEQINRLEQAGEEGRYLFGFEESYGCLPGTLVRDKDAVAASLAVCKMAAYYKERGKSLADRLEELYRRYGKYVYRLLSYECAGAAGARVIKAFMARMRAAFPAEICGKRVARRVDYLLQETGLPKADVLAFDFEDGCRLVMRPSGTEPLVKVYLTIVGGGDAETEIAAFDGYMKKVLSEIETK